MPIQRPAAYWPQAGFRRFSCLQWQKLARHKPFVKPSRLPGSWPHGTFVLTRYLPFMNDRYLQHRTNNPDPLQFATAYDSRLSHSSLRLLIPQRRELHQHGQFPVRQVGFLVTLLVRTMRCATHSISFRAERSDFSAALFDGHAVGVGCVLHVHGGRIPVSNGAADSARRIEPISLG